MVYKKEAATKEFMQNCEIKPGVKASDIVKWIKEDYKLRHGHSIAIYALLKDVKNEKSK